MKPLMAACTKPGLGVGKVVPSMTYALLNRRTVVEMVDVKASRAVQPNTSAAASERATHPAIPKCALRALAKAVEGKPDSAIRASPANAAPTEPQCSAYMTAVLGAVQG